MQDIAVRHRDPLWLPSRPRRVEDIRRPFLVLRNQRIIGIRFHFIIPLDQVSRYFTGQRLIRRLRNNRVYLRVLKHELDTFLRKKRLHRNIGGATPQDGENRSYHRRSMIHNDSYAPATIG